MKRPHDRLHSLRIKLGIARKKADRAAAAYDAAPRDPIKAYVAGFWKGLERQLEERLEAARRVE